MRTQWGSAGCFAKKHRGGPNTIPSPAGLDCQVMPSGARAASAQARKRLAAGTMDGMRAGIISAFLIVAATTAEATEIRKELSAAKSIAVLVHFVYPEEEPSGFVDKIRSRAIAEIQKRKRFEVVDDPSKADLVCLYVLYGPQWVEQRKTKELVAESLGSSLIILKGGASPHWDASPLWMYSDALERWTISLPQSLTAFHRQLAKGKTRQQQPPPSQDVSRTEIVSDRPSVFLTCPEADFCKGAEAMQPSVTSHWFQSR